jgi:tRNA dimethylallyltransferase
MVNVTKKSENTPVNPLTAKPIKIVVILGPTASGKTAYSIKLAKKINGEIISADSRQVYKGLDLGTGKVTKKEMSGIRHYLLNVADPKKKFTVHEYVKLAEKAIGDIISRGKVPIICGGTGFYIQALVDGLIIPEVPPNIKLRKKMEKMSIAKMLSILKKFDPKRYRTIDRNNPRRIIRAIEIATALGKVPLLKSVSKYDPEFIGITLPKEILRERIHKRLLDRLKAGMINEVRNLHTKGLSWKRMEELGLEYRFIARFLQNKITKEEMIKQLETASNQYAKRQMTWFKRDKRLRWMNKNL